MCKKTQPSQKENHNGDNKNLNSRKNEIISSIGKANELLKEYKCQDRLWCHKLIMFISVCAFVFFFINTAKGILFEIKDNQQLIYIAFCLIVESLLFIWWMKFLGKLLTDARDSMNAWQTKMTDVCGFLVDMETILYKAEIEKEKKRIEKADEATATPVNKPTVEGIVKEAIETMMEDKRKECTEIGWVVRLKDTDSKK